VRHLRQNIGPTYRRRSARRDRLPGHAAGVERWESSWRKIWRINLYAAAAAFDPSWPGKARSASSREVSRPSRFCATIRTWMPGQGGRDVCWRARVTCSAACLGARAAAQRVVVHRLDREISMGDIFRPRQGADVVRDRVQRR
jgi:hypothetical protein